MKAITCWQTIFRICALHFTHPSAHTQQLVVNTHTPWTHIFHVQYWKLIQYDWRILFTLKCPLFFLPTDDLFFGTVADSCVLLLGAAGRTHGRKGVWRCGLARSGVRYHPGDVTCHDSRTHRRPNSKCWYQSVMENRNRLKQMFYWAYSVLKTSTVTHDTVRYTEVKAHASEWLVSKV